VLTYLTYLTHPTYLTYLTYPTHPTYLTYATHLPIRIVRRARARGLLHARRDLPQRRDVVHDPERPAHRRRDEIPVVDLDTGGGRRRQILLQRLPVLALIEGHERPFARARIEQAFLLGILAHDVHRLVGRD